MKKYIVISIIGILSIQLFLTESICKSILNNTLPIINIVNNEKSGIRLLSHINILKDRNLNVEIFNQMPEDKIVESDKLEEDEIVYEVPKEEKSEEIIDNSKEVTLEWKNILKNETKYNIDVDKLKNEKLNFNLSKKNIDVLIYHTHATECYTVSSGYEYEASGVFRTLNKNVSVIKIGNTIKDYLQKNGIGVYHDETLYDYPNYNLSYTNAGKSIPNLLKKYSDAKIVLDVHRDAIGVGTEQYKPVVKIDGENVAQFLLVIGTNQGGLNHSEWRENLKLALKIKELADEKYPGLCRYIILRKERFNQQVAPGAMIVEMGATGNTVPEVMRTSKYFAEILSEVAKND